MRGFVERCRQEWDRLGVPDAVSSEMAADLAADLAEAEAEGVSPEEVLGNGVFDPRSFAASWATARGVVPVGHRAEARVRPAAWALVVGAVLSLASVAAGLAVVGRRRTATAVAMAVRHSPTLPLPLPPHALFIGPRLPGRLILQSNGPLLFVGVVLLLVGLAGLGVTLWLWRPWSASRRRGWDENVGLPSYL